MNNTKIYKIAIFLLSIIVIWQWIIIVKISKPKKPITKPLAVIKGKIAIVLDDWGYNLNNLTILEQIKYPLTLSVLPNLSYSKAVTADLNQKGFEIILHLPMEPSEKFRLEKHTIMTNMDEQTIINILKQDLNSVFNAKGISNHMGSRATKDSKTMEIIFKELKKRGLYFLDSFVSSKSICSELAHKIKLGFARRDVFLDNKQDPEYIKGQIFRLKIKASTYGQAIGIGHDRNTTLEVLKEVMPVLEKEGYKFVFVSDLIH